ncbi:hypothetical protein PPERSA_06673 [Pseudocohnilembus persalinus]|uniref:protein-tyrosine-phosphatase n=1 Tax=Pseudocohnilembus persalinus TaxID=266149 RepID=A0A0V0QRV5_PSEPJ|nr:hypothetical protein PPERSA_06673 [Pseudocohnilembus persalinus]|eukprot:KRX05039.1 hypothetical protein PPERSA_06673 [Pseudocohnilembus persalinus]
MPHNNLICILLQFFSLKHLSTCEVCFVSDADPQLIVEDFPSGVCKLCHSVLGYIEKHLPELKNFKLKKGFYKPQIDCIIEDKLYLGNFHGARNRDLLDKHGITHVVVAGHHMKEFDKEKYTYKLLDYADSAEQNIVSTFQEVIDFIDNGEKVLVHCFAGVSRSASLVIAYIMKNMKLSYNQAYAYVKERRDKIRPNNGFVKQLQIYEQNLKDQKVIQE